MLKINLLLLQSKIGVFLEIVFRIRPCEVTEHNVPDDWLLNLCPFSILRLRGKLLQGQDTLRLDLKQRFLRRQLYVDATFWKLRAKAGALTASEKKDSNFSLGN